MTLPFGLKQKPLNHYINQGIVRFHMIQGSLCYEVKAISKKGNYLLQNGIIKDKEQLDRLLNMKSLHEIPLIEEVVS